MHTLGSSAGSHTVFGLGEKRGDHKVLREKQATSALPASKEELKSAPREPSLARLREWGDSLSLDNFAFFSFPMPTISTSSKCSIHIFDTLSSSLLIITHFIRHSICKPRDSSKLVIVL